MLDTSAYFGFRVASGKLYARSSIEKALAHWKCLQAPDYKGWPEYELDDVEHV
jgi:CRISPR/Cas system-associated protein Cas10 (large subunit of type III CRISPR-Cas system)